MTDSTHNGQTELMEILNELGTDLCSVVACLSCIEDKLESILCELEAINDGIDSAG